MDRIHDHHFLNQLYIHLLEVEIDTRSDKGCGICMNDNVCK